MFFEILRLQKYLSFKYIWYIFKLSLCSEGKKILKKEKAELFQPEISLERENCVEILKRNIERYMKHSGCTMRELAEDADIPYATLNNLLYSKTHKDCKISTILCLSKAMGVSVDELLGGATMTEEERFLLSTLRRMPDRTRYIIHWFLEYQRKIMECYSHPKTRVINVMQPNIDTLGNLQLSSQFTPLDISAFSTEIKTKVFMGLHVACGYYMPLFCPYDVLLIANDRPARSTEICIVVFYEHIHFMRRITTKINGETIVQYTSIRDGHIHATENEIDIVVGYVADVYREYGAAAQNF